MRALRKTRLVCCHVRKGDFVELQARPSLELTPGAAAAPAAAVAGRALPEDAVAATAPSAARGQRGQQRTEPPFEEGGEEGDAWDEVSGANFRAPLEWYAHTLSQPRLLGQPAEGGGCGVEAVGGNGFAVGDGDLIWVCTDDPQLAAAPAVGQHKAVSWATMLPLLCSAQCADSGGEDHARLLRAAVERDLTLADWVLMQTADVLLCSNSTFSFTAAMLSSVPGAVFMRPDPHAQELVGFDPWDAMPLLKKRNVPWPPRQG